MVLFAISKPLEYQWFGKLISNEKFKINVHEIELDLKYKYNAKYM